MSRATLIFLAGTGSALLLAGAYVFQWLGYEPCHLCWFQRYPHMAAVGFMVIASVTGAMLGVWALLGALAALTTSAIGLYHTGVERGWWEGPTSCTGEASAGMSGSDLLSMTAPVHVVRCDEVQWAFAGLSMASWNAVFSLVLALIWVAALRRD